jgi:hypothetical protein
VVNVILRMVWRVACLALLLALCNAIVEPGNASGLLSSWPPDQVRCPSHP